MSGVSKSVELLYSFPPYLRDLQNYLSEAGSFLWITVTAAVTGLFSSLLFLHWTCPQFVNDISSVLSALRNGVEVSFCEALSNNPHSTSCRISEEVQHSILRKSVELDTTYRRASFQLGLGRVSGTDISAYDRLLFPSQSKL